MNIQVADHVERPNADDRSHPEDRRRRNRRGARGQDRSEAKHRGEPDDGIMGIHGKTLIGGGPTCQ